MRKTLISIIGIIAIFILAIAIRFTLHPIDKAIDKDAIAYAVDIATDSAILPSLQASNSLVMPIVWEEIAKGIEFTYRNEPLTLDISTNTQNTSTFNVYIVKIDPKIIDFALHGSFLEEDKKSFTMQEWANNKNLAVAINASMYLPDNTTSTGHMRVKDMINNSHIAKNMGGFFLCNQDNKASLILEKSQENWLETLNAFDVAVQNFRILGTSSDDTAIKTLWHYTNDKHAIAAYGQDIQGNIYFIFSQNPTTVYELGQYLLALSDVGIDFKTVLYAEGGREAALYINTDVKQLYVSGMQNYLLNFSTPLPNIIGVKVP